MKIAMRKTLLRTAFVLTIGIAGLTVAPHAIPAAHASASPPTVALSLTYTSSDAILHVSGTVYTVYGQVEIDVFLGAIPYRLLTQTYVQSSPALTYPCVRTSLGLYLCRITGAISSDFHLARGTGSISVIATDLKSGQQSNAPSAYIA